MFKGYFRRGHFNPATSVACAMLKQIDWATAAYYALGQFMGGLFGSLLLWLCWFTLVPTGSQLGATVTNEDTSVWQGLACEMVLSFIFHTVLLGFYTVSNNGGKTSTTATTKKDGNDDDETKIESGGGVGASSSSSSSSDDDDDNTNGPMGQEMKTLDDFLSSHDTGSMGLYVAFVMIVCLVIGLTVSGGSMNPARSFGPAAISGVWYNHWIYWVGPFSGAALAAVLVGTLQEP